MRAAQAAGGQPAKGGLVEDRALASSTPRFLNRSSASRSRVMATHLPGLLICGGVLLMSALIPYRDTLADVCALKRWVEIPCPLCGSTRTFAAAIQGDFGWAWKNSPLATVLFGAVFLAFAWNAGGIMTRSLWLPGRWLKPPVLTGRRVFWIVFLAVCSNYAYRLIAGLY